MGAELTSTLHNRGAGAVLVSSRRGSAGSRIAFFLIASTLFFSVWFPKAGLKAGDLPLTVGNLLFGLLLLVCGTAFVGGRRIASTPLTAAVAVSVGYFAIRTLYAGISGEPFVQYLVSLALAPLAFLAMTNIVTTSRQFRILSRILVWGVFFLCAYALLQTALGINGVAVPGLTVNATDYASGSDWYLQKNNRVGDSNKIPSTFQNGNLFGVNLVLIFPLAYELMSRRMKPIGLIAFSVAIVLTLSRSAWLGLAVFLLLRFVFTRVKSPIALLPRALAVVGLVAVVPIFANLFPQVAGRMFGSDFSDLTRLAGRTPALEELLNTTLGNPLALIFGPYGLTPFSGTAYEMTYFAIYMVAGAIGVVLFIGLLFRSFNALGRVKASSPSVIRGVRLSIVCYGITAFIEGGLWLPPTAVLLWLVIGFGFVASRLSNDSQNVEN